MSRVLIPGGLVLVLEFSKTDNPALTKLYVLYCFYILPKMCLAIAVVAESYRFLAESIRMHPYQETL
jgi:demethylmenaquinone methyltransferase/2-methoxy-6-polyprenyl-1,4-benzoquinol methylase